MNFLNEENIERKKNETKWNEIKIWESCRRIMAKTAFSFLI